MSSTHAKPPRVQSASEPIMLPLIEEHINDIAQLCERYGVRKLELFGSACRGEFDPETSDLDFVAEFVDRRNISYLDRYLDFADAIEALVGRKIDLVTATSSMSPHFRRELNKCRVVVYEADGRVAAA
jgi:predicted nucleotidyltransferase